MIYLKVPIVYSGFCNCNDLFDLFFVAQSFDISSVYPVYIQCISSVFPSTYLTHACSRLKKLKSLKTPLRTHPASHSPFNFRYSSLTQSLLVLLISSYKPPLSSDITFFRKVLSQSGVGLCLVGHEGALSAPTTFPPD